MASFLSPAFAGLAPYTPGEQPPAGTKVKLNTNESPYPPPAEVVAAVTAEAARLQLYSNPDCTEVIEPLAQWLGLAPQQVFVGNGSDEVLAFCFQGFCPNGAAFADLTYGFYPVYAALYGLQTKLIPLREDFSIAPEDYANTGKTIFIANPNAPTGLALSAAQIEQILQANPGILVVVDEAYVYFGAESAVPLLERYPNLLVVGTFSKSRSMAGARLGYAAGSPGLIADLNRIKFSFNPYNVNRVTLAAGAASLQNQPYFEECIAAVVQTRAHALQTLREMGFCCTESLANFVFVSHPDAPAKALYNHLRRKGILVRWFNQPRIENHLRITIGTPQQMQLLYTALKEIIAQRQ